METIRLIYYSTPDGKIEGVYFTTDMNSLAEDFIPSRCQVASDQKIEMNTSGFPLEWNLEKRHVS